MCKVVIEDQPGPIPFHGRDLFLFQGMRIGDPRLQRHLAALGVPMVDLEEFLAGKAAIEQHKPALDADIAEALRQLDLKSEPPPGGKSPKKSDKPAAGCSPAAQPEEVK